jgi:hypothetical protein
VKTRVPEAEKQATAVFGNFSSLRVTLQDELNILVADVEQSSSEPVLTK